LAELKLTQIAEIYAQVLDDAARKNSSAFDVLSALVGAEIAARHQRALLRRIREARLPPRKTVEEFDFTFPKRIPWMIGPEAVRGTLSRCTPRPRSAPRAAARQPLSGTAVSVREIRVARAPPARACRERRTRSGSSSTTH
jgi:hypothetical protein